MLSGNDLFDTMLNLGLALALGLLVGTERGWQERAAAEGSRVAGIRNFGLIGLLGALLQLMAASVGETLLGLAFLAFVLLMVVAHVTKPALPSTTASPRWLPRSSPLFSARSPCAGNAGSPPPARS